MNKYFRIFLVCEGCFIVSIFLFLKSQIAIETCLALNIGSILLAVVLHDALTVSGDGMDLSISNLPGFYGFFYALYYLGALVLFSVRDDSPKDHILGISGLMFLGYLGWRSGLALSGGRKAAMRLPAIEEREAKSLLILCWIGFAAVLVGYGYKASVGAFFSHGGEYFQEPTLAASFLQNLTFQFELPVLLLATLLSVRGVARKPAKASLWVFMGIVSAIHLAASEFRTILTDLVVIAAMLQFGSGFRLTWRRLFGATCVCSVCLLVIQASRIEAAEQGGGSLGPIESVSLLVDAVENLTVNSLETTEMNTTARGSNSLLFLSTLIDRVRSGEPYLKGKVMMYELSSLLPRAVWPDKPVFSSTQREIRREFGMPIHDDSSGPLIAYYAFGGPVGVFCGLFSFGLFLGLLRNWVANSNTTISWMVLLWALSAAVSVESDQMLDLIGDLRLCFVAYVIFRLIHFTYPIPRFRPSQKSFERRSGLTGML